MCLDGNTIASGSNRKGLLALPMPRMVPGSEDLSGDDDYLSSPSASVRSGYKHNNTHSSSSGTRRETRRKRPTILNRRNSRTQVNKDWGERCVDVFEVIAQIGEGTYGQVIRRFIWNICRQVPAWHRNPRALILSNISIGVQSKRQSSQRNGRIEKSSAGAWERRFPDYGCAWN